MSDFNISLGPLALFSELQFEKNKRQNSDKFLHVALILQNYNKQNKCKNKTLKHLTEEE